MKVEIIDTVSKRSDGKPGGATRVTLGKIYNVVEIGDTQYSIINDDYKLARYSKYRFRVVDDTPIKDIRSSFNMLTWDVRMLLKETVQENKVLKDFLKENGFDVNQILGK